jgi:hypothetical protein
VADEVDRSRLWIVLEDIFIVVSIFALWPAILGWEGWVWEVLKYAAAAGLLWIFIRRVQRYNRRRDASSNEQAT